MRTLWLSLMCCSSPAWAATTIQVDAGRGPVSVLVPDTAAAGDVMPLIVLLHGYGSTGPSQSTYFGLHHLVDDYGFAYVAPTGEKDLIGLHAWTATNVCCGLVHPHDDSTYLATLIDTIEDTIAVDPKGVHFVGHSNGGFMSYRMACDHSERVASVASLAGATWDDPADCNATDPVHVVQIHGSNDATILAEGDCWWPGGCYPSATGTALRWAVSNGCVGGPSRGPDLDLVGPLTGAETRTWSVEACDDGGSAAVWLSNTTHVPALSAQFAVEVVEWSLTHNKP